MGSGFDDQVVFRGPVVFGPGASVALPASVVGNAQVAVGAGITADKLQHAHRGIFAQATGSAATANAGTVVHVVRGATGTLKAVGAGSIAKAVGDSTVTVDVKKNGTTVLTATIVLDNANTARVAEAGTLSVTSLVAGDVIEVSVAVSAGTGTLPQGVFAFVDLWEDPQ